MTRHWWAEIDGLLVPTMLLGLGGVALFALLFRFLPEHPAWAAVVMYVALGLLAVALGRVVVLVRRITA